MPITVIAAVYVALFWYYLQRSIIVEPFWDMYSHVLRYLQFRENGAWWSYLWEPHVQHRQVWMRLLTAFDVEVFNGAAYPFIVTAAACIVVAAWLLWRETRAVRPPALRTTIGAFVVMLVLTIPAAVDSAVPIFVVYPHALFFTVVAIVFFDGEREATGSPRWTPWRRVVALMAAAGAAFANAATLPLWPILIWTAWRARAGAAWITAITVTATVFIALYVQGLPLTAQAAVAPGGGAFAEWLRTADYLLTYLGLPWTRAAQLSVAGRIVGAALLIAGIYVVVRHGLLRPPDGRLERVAVALVMFSLATALLAALGRADLDADVRVPVRYSLFVTPLHIGLLWLATPSLTRQWHMAERRRYFRAAALAAGVLLLVQQVAAGQAAVATTEAMRASIRRFMAGKTEAGMERVVFDDLEQARRSWNTIRGAGLYTGR